MSAAPRPRPLAFLLACLMTSLAACGGDNVVQPEGTSSSSGDTTTQVPTSTSTMSTTGEPITGTDSSTTTTGDTSTGASTTLASTSTGLTTEDTGTTGDTTGTTTEDTAGATCCAASDVPGCGDVEIESCVCEKHPACCTDAWSQACVAAVDIDACSDCGGPPPPSPCCGAGLGPGCSEPGIELCVCEQMPECCSELWTTECAAAVEGMLCGSCGGGVEECCAVQPDPGCPSPEIQACVCANDTFCCKDAWDDVCVGKVDSLGCAMCPVPPGPCCEAHEGAGCEDPAVVECVCAEMPGCCGQSWGPECVDAVETLGCAMCPSNCCTARDTPGCEDMAIQDCVCAFDAYCCETEWDGTCVFEVEDKLCGSCQ